MPRVCPTPTTVRVGKVYLYPVHGLSLVLLLGLEYELLEDGVVPGDYGHGDDLAAGVALAPTLDAQPMAAIIDGMRRVGRRLEDDTSLDTAGSVVLVIVLITERVVGHSGAETRSGATRRGLKLARALPFRASGEPKHEPVIRVVLLGEVGSEEEGWVVRKVSRQALGRGGRDVQFMKWDLESRTSGRQRAYSRDV